jgi:thioredoxin reductase (NADPH)
MSENIERIKCLIIGSGPAGYTAAIYAARADMKPVMYTGMQMGGQLTTTTEVDNFPGYPNGTDGPKMMEDLKNQAERFGTDVRFGLATSVELSTEVGGIHKIVVDESKHIEAETVIISTGATAKYLGLESEQRLIGGGVSACATCDGFFYKGKKTVVIGGGDSAMEEATYLANICEEVVLVHRRDHFRASKIMVDRAKNHPKIKFKVPYNIEKCIEGPQGVEGVVLVHAETGEKEEYHAPGVFMAIGHKPNSDVFSDFVDTDEHGYIKTTDFTATNVPGVFSAGDISDSVFRQAITAAGLGCQAAIQAGRFLESEHS